MNPVLIVRNVVVLTLLIVSLILKQSNHDYLETTLLNYNSNNTVNYTAEKPDLLKPKRVQHVLLWTQCRSGSNFVGDFLANSWNDRFYFEEPIKFWIKYFKGSMETEKLTKFLESILSCEFHRYPEWNKKRKRLLNEAIELGPFMGNSSVITDSLDFHLISCQHSKIRFFRIVHPNLGIALPLLKNKELNVKIIYLARDPRGIIASRKTLKDENQFDMDLDTPHPCLRLQQDLPYIKNFRKNYSDRFLMIRYEDLCLRPMLYFRRLFRFAGQDFEPRHGMKLAKHVRNRDGKKHSNPLSTYRDSSVTALKWMTKLEFNAVRKIQVQCGESLSYLNYTIFRSENEFLNASSRARIKLDVIEALINPSDEEGSYRVAA